MTIMETSSLLVRSHMHTEEQLSDWLLITMTSRHSSGQDCCQVDSVQVDIVQCGTSAAKQSAEAQRSNTVWGCFSLQDHGACLLWYSLHSFTDVFIYLWVWLSNQQRIHISLPHEEPCHIYIFLIAHNSNSPDLTCPIKKMQHFRLTSNFLPKTVCSINPFSSPYPDVCHLNIHYNDPQVVKDIACYCFLCIYTTAC